MQCINMGSLQILLTCLAKFQDYEVTTQLYRALGNYLTSGLHDDVAAQNPGYAQYCSDIRNRAAQEGCLQQLHAAYEGSQYFRIRRICGEYLQKLYEPR